MDGEIRTTSELEAVAQQLADNELEECRIKKEEVMGFGAIIRNRSDFLHFHGNAQKGGDVIYTYLQEPRS